MAAAVFAVTFAIVAVVMLALFGDDRSITGNYGARGLWLFAGGAALIAAVAASVTFSHRRRIARAADEVAVATLATGVKAKRKVGEKAASYRQRIIDRADEA